MFWGVIACWGEMMRHVLLIFIYDDREVDLRSQESHLWTLHQIYCLVNPDSQVLS